MKTEDRLTRESLLKAMVESKINELTLLHKTKAIDKRAIISLQREIEALNERVSSLHNVLAAAGIAIGILAFFVVIQLVV